MDHQQSDKKAFVTLISVVVLSAVASLMIATNLLINSDSNIAINIERDSIEAKNLAHSCAEIALNKLKLSTNYVGNENITLDFGTCTIATITGTGNSNRVISTTGTKDNVVKKVTVSVTTVNPTAVISSWVEIP